MLSYISAKEAAEKWNISQRRVAILCSEARVDHPCECRKADRQAYRSL